MTKAADVTLTLPLAGPPVKPKAVVLEQDCCNLSMVGVFARHKMTHLCQLVYHHKDCCMALFSLLLGQVSDPIHGDHLDYCEWVASNENDGQRSILQI